MAPDDPLDTRPALARLVEAVGLACYVSPGDLSRVQWRSGIGRAWASHQGLYLAVILWGPSGPALCSLPIADDVARIAERIRRAVGAPPIKANASPL